MPLSALEDLRTYKLPALDRSRTIKSGSQAPRILLFARTGFTQALVDASADDDRVELIDAGMLAANLLEGD